MKASDFVIENGSLIQYIGKDEHVEIPSNVSSIRDFAFAENKKIKSVVMPNSIFEMTNGVFAKCKKLERVIFSDSLTEIGSFTFHECSNLIDVQLPKSLNRINRLVFYKCKKLSEVVLPNGVSYIGANAFEGCASLAKITLPCSVERICDRAFARCTDLREISIMGEDLNIGHSLFAEASPNIKIEYSGTSAAFVNMIFNPKRQPMPWLTIGHAAPYQPARQSEEQFIYDAENTFHIAVLCKKDGKTLTFRSNKDERSAMS